MKVSLFRAVNQIACDDQSRRHSTNGVGYLIYCWLSDSTSALRLCASVGDPGRSSVATDGVRQIRLEVD